MVIASLAGILVAYLAIDDWCGWREWAAACAEADRLDPGWRWEDLVAHMPAIPDERNSAVHLAAARALLPARLPPETWFALDSGRNLTPPPQRLRPVVADRLATMLGSAPKAVAECRALADCPSGRFPWPSLPPANAPPSPGLSPLDDGQVLRYLLFPQLVLQTEAKDFDGALVAYRAILFAARISTAPGQSDVRFANSYHQSAVRGLERILAQGEPSLAALEATRRLFGEEVDGPVLLTAFRHERAVIEGTIRELTAGRLNRSTGGRPFYPSPRVDVIGWKLVDDWLDDRSFSRPNAAALVRHLNWIIEILKESPEALQPLASEWVARRQQFVPSVRSAADAYAGLVSEWCDSEALMRSAGTALAAEQFRRGHGRWPASLDELVPQLLAAVPRDPFDLQPIRMARHAEGIVIYSVGPNGTDDGGDLRPEKPTSDTPRDIGIRLWDIEKRRQPPPK
jgi:hypothetical protein